MPTNNIPDFAAYGEAMGNRLDDAITGTLTGLGDSFASNATGSSILSALSVVAVAFLVLAGFWIVVRNLIRAANMTGRRR